MLDVQNISFSWGKTSLFDDVTFSVAPGEVAALVGANGVGKTTLMKILAGVILPSSGTVLVDGQDAFRNSMRYHRMMGYLPENAPAEPDMSVKAYLTYRAHLKGEMAKKIRPTAVAIVESGTLPSVSMAIPLAWETRASPAADSSVAHTK